MTTLKKVLKIFNKRTKTTLVILLGAIIFGALLEMAALALVSPFIYVLLDSSALYENSIIGWVFHALGFTSTSAFLALLAFLLASMYFLRGSYMYVLNRQKYHFLAQNQANMSKKLLDKTLSFSYTYHTKYNLAELQRGISGDVEQMILVVSAFLRFATDFFTIVAISIFLLISSPIMTFFVIGLAGICLILYLRIFRKKVRVAGTRSRKSHIEMEKSILQALGGIKEVKMAQREAYFSNAFKVSSDDFVEANTLYKSLDIVPKLVIETICFGGAFIIIGLFILAGADMSDLVPQLSLFVFAAFRLLPAVSRLATYVNIILFNKPSIDAVYTSLFENDHYSQEVEEPILTKGKCEKGLVVDRLTFKYPEGTDYLFNNVSFEIPEKKSIAFVGTSGAGKSTLIDLILGVLSPIEGGVFFNGKSIHHHFSQWSGQVGYIPQQIYLLDESIRNNIAFGIDEKDIEDDKIWRALESSQLKSFVESLPKGLDTVIGDRGIRISGGQRQRIGIARALYEDPPILVLDEATSSLDHETERAVMEAVVAFKGSKTMLIVAHRLSTIDHCDLVYRVGHNNVVIEKEQR